jgi:hypothetical protein
MQVDTNQRCRAQLQGGRVMRLRMRFNIATRACAFVFPVALVWMTLTASASAVNPERAYELVSPAYKGGYGANEIRAVAPDGESVAFFSFGAFAGAPVNLVANIYLARRGTSGWSTTPLTPSAVTAPFATLENPIDFSATLESSLSFTVLGPNRGEAYYEGNEDEFLLHRSDAPDVDAGFEIAGEIIKTIGERQVLASYHGASSDLSHIVFSVDNDREPLLPEYQEVNENSIYDLASHGVAGQSLQLIGIDNKDKLLDPESCKIILGNEYGLLNGERISSSNAISADGSEIFFQATLEGCTRGEHEQLFVRLGGSKTLEVGKPPSEACSEVPCPGAVARASTLFQGASEDGSKVFFTTAAPLVSHDKDASTDLYMASIGCPSGTGEGCEAAQREVRSLVQISHALVAGEAAAVQNVVAISPDGLHVYFVARGVLSEGPNAEGDLAVSGADNLYVYDSASGKPPLFVADLCSGPELSGVSKDVQCPSHLREGNPEHGGENDMHLWEQAPEAQTTRDGQFLVFSCYAQLLPGDTDTAKDVYRYDARTGALDRVSVGEGGYDGNGDNNNFDASIAKYSEDGLVAKEHNLSDRAISEDGSRIVFTTADPLSPSAVNGLVNVYEWHKQPDWSEGKVSLISSGSSDESDGDVVISSSGGNVFFLTSQGLVTQDVDGAQDVYDARLGGGFPQSPAAQQPCAGDACQGPLTNPAPLLIPGSVSQAPGENLSPPTAVKAKLKAKAKTKRKVKKRASSRKRAGRAKKGSGRSWR